MKKPEELRPLMEEVLYGLDHDLFKDDVGRAVLRLWQLGLIEPKAAEIIEGRVNRHRYMTAMRRNPFPEPKLGGAS